MERLKIKDTLRLRNRKVIAFLDTCFSGGLHSKGPTQPDIDKLANELASAEKGVVVFTSSTGRQFSLEKTGGPFEVGNQVLIVRARAIIPH